jgi:large subunit ribosomal protein L25
LAAGNRQVVAEKRDADFAAGGWKVFRRCSCRRDLQVGREASSWKLAAGNWKLIRSRQLEAGSWKLEAVFMDATLQAEKRDGRGKNDARRLRASGRIPAVVYGTEKGKALEIAVDPKMLMRILHSESGVNTLIGLQVEGGDTRVLVKEYQIDPIDHELLHADFYQVAMDKALTVTVPLVMKGEAPGVKQQGGIVDFVNREIEIECLPGDIPENIAVDISELMLNQGLRVRDLLTAGAKWTPVTDGDLMIVHVVALKAEEPAATEPVAGAVAAPAEPEVIKKGKTDKEDEK